MVDYNIAFYNIRTEYWYQDVINLRAATCYIKFGEKYFEHIQPLRPDNQDINVIKDDEIFIHRAKFIPSAQVLEGIVNYIIPLYIHVM